MSDNETFSETNVGGISCFTLMSRKKVVSRYSETDMEI